MLDQLRRYQFKASSILETMVAAVLILFSFWAGMALYQQVLRSGWSDRQMAAMLEQEYLADSLSRAPEYVDQHLQRGELDYEVAFVEEERFEGLLQLHIAVYDRSGKRLARLRRLIDDSGQKYTPFR